MAAALAVTLAGCSGSTPPLTAAGTSPAASTGRWWSNTAVKAGSPVDQADPGAAAAGLRSSTKDYCGMLTETMRSGRSVLTGPGAGASLSTLKAFVAEIEKVAPSAVSGAWQVLGPALVGFAESQGSSLGPHTADASRLAAAAQQISSHASSVCKVDLAALPRS